MNRLSLRQLSIAMSFTFMVFFVVCYLSFKYFWSFEKEKQAAQLMQQAEIERVQSVISITKLDIAALIADYAAWDQIVEFIQKPTPSFIEENIGAHAFVSNDLDGVLIFDRDIQLVWGKRFDNDSQQDLPFGSITYRFGSLLADTLISNSEKINPFVKFIVLDDQPYLLATSRVCNSQGNDCRYGYLMFLRKAGAQFISEIEKSTGIDIELIVDKHQNFNYPASENISYIRKLDYQNKSTFLIKINHFTTLPKFIEAKEVLALSTVSLLLFLFHLFAVQLFITPLRNAENVLANFKDNGGEMPDENSFISSEMKHFASMINTLIRDLEDSRSELKWLSEHDPLTSTANRRKLENEIESILTSGQYQYMSLFLIDIDHFKLFNDYYGHIAGDEALISVAHALDKLDLNELMFNGDSFVARFGGEEFCVVLCSNKAIDAESAAKQMLQVIEQLNTPHQLSTTKPILSISIGGVIIDDFRIDDSRIDDSRIDCYQDILLAADSALYKSKLSGRDTYTIKAL